MLETVRSLRAHALRFGLTALGVAWGAFMLTYLTASMEGMQQHFHREFTELGPNLVFFGGGDGVVYAFETLRELPPEGAVLKLKRAWRFDCDPTAPKKDIHKYKHNKEVGPSNIKSMPVFHRGRVYVTVGGDIWWGKNKAWLKCIDASKTGDITHTDLAGHWINLFFDHETPAVKIESPYTHEALRIKVKQPGTLFVRRPSWVEPAAMTITGVTEARHLTNGYLFIARPPLNRFITFEFPMPTAELILPHRTRRIKQPRQRQQITRRPPRAGAAKNRDRHHFLQVLYLEILKKMVPVPIFPTSTGLHSLVVCHYTRDIEKSLYVFNPAF